jgi:WD repeat-containing protein 26
MRLDPESSTANGSQYSSNGTAHAIRHLNGHSDSPNGHSPAKNGTSNAPRNGLSTSMSRSISPTFFGHNREEVTRLLIQGLTDLGYQGAADRLSQESGYEVESPSVAAFRHAVLQGEWSEAESLLFGSTDADDGGGVSIGQGDVRRHAGLDFADGVDFDELKFQMREQKYLELLEARDLGNALMVLRQELTPLNHDTAKLHHLSRYVRLANLEGFMFPSESQSAAMETYCDVA